MTALLLALFLLLCFQLYLRRQQRKVQLAKPTWTHSNTQPTKDFVPEENLQSPDWVKNAVVYQLNVRQFTPEGNFQAVLPHLKRIRQLGADIIWLMPIFPICETNRKCDPDDESPCWGSPYAPYDYEAIHPLYGTEADFQDLVNAIHAEGMKVILDFVPNHTGFDSKWMLEHPEWFVQKNGRIMPVTSDQGEEWADIAQLDLTNRAMREAWMQAHEYWVKRFGIDGYREDCAWAIPYDMWRELRQRLNALRPVYMLAEDEIHGKEQFAVCFEANYGWGAHHFMKKIAKGELPATALFEHTEGIKSRFGRRGWQLNFTQNHDENTWHGTEIELFGSIEAADCFTALCFLMEGQPLIYNGQEVSLDKRLAFFNKDVINWAGRSRAAFFSTLTGLKHTNRALWHGESGGFIQKITTNADDKLYAFLREKDGDRVVAIFNLSAEAITTRLEGKTFEGDYVDVFTPSVTSTLTEGVVFEMPSFGFLIFSSVK